MRASVYAYLVATKTISVDLEAYDCLRRARRTPTESFSQVIKRAVWPSGGCTGDDLLRAVAGSEPTDEVVLARLEKAQRQDAPQGDPWRAP